MPFKDPVRQKQYMQQYNANHKYKERRAELYIINREKILKRSKAYRAKNKERLQLQERKRAPERNTKYRKQSQILKLEVLSHYSAGTPKCACCGESQIEFLSIDHINGGGNEHRNSIHVKSGTRFYSWLKRNTYPENFQVLCMNCNFAKGKLGYCPHQNLEKLMIRKE